MIGRRENFFPGVIGAIVTGFFQLIERAQLIVERLASANFAAHDVAQDAFQVLPLGFGDFDELVLVVNLGLGFLDLLFDRFQLLGSELVAHAQLVLAAVDVEEGGLKFLFA